VGEGAAPLPDAAQRALNRREGERSTHPHPAAPAAAGFGIEDGERAAIALRGIEGKRLTYRRINEA